MIERVRALFFAGVLVVATASLSTGCKKTESPAPPAPAAAAPSAAEGAAPATAAGTDQPAGEDKGAAAPAAEAEGQGEAGEKLPAGEAGGEDKTEIGKTFIEVYCAQKAGETEKLFDIYSRHGYTDPATWTKVWTAAAKDKPWVARITQDALRACP